MKDSGQNIFCFFFILDKNKCTSFFSLLLSLIYEKQYTAQFVDIVYSWLSLLVDVPLHPHEAFEWRHVLSQGRLFFLTSN